MKRHSNSLYHFVFAALVPLVLGTAAYAKEEKIGVVDMQRALVSVEAGKKARSELEKEVNARKKEIETLKNKFEAESKEYSNKASLIKEDARKKKETELQGQILKINARQAQIPEELGKKEQELTLPIYNKLKTVIADTAKKENFTLVLEKNAVLYTADEKADITGSVISAFDKHSK